MTKTVVTCTGLLVLLLARQGQAACATVPQLQGEPALVALVTDELGRRKSAELGSDCSPLHVQLSSQNGLYLVGIEDPSGRRSERQVASVAMVATLIETWMMPGLDKPDLEPTPLVLAAPVTTPAPSRLALSIQAESAMANDRSLWMGVAGMACLRLGRFCPGSLLRFADDEGWAGGKGPRPSRRSLQALLAASVPFTLGRVRLVPRTGLGVAWTWEDQPQEVHPGRPAPENQRGWLRAEAGISSQLLVRRAWALSLDISGELAPMVLDARISNARDVHEPWILYRLGLGVAWGTP